MGGESVELADDTGGESIRSVELEIFLGEFEPCCPSKFDVPVVVLVVAVTVDDVFAFITPNCKYEFPYGSVIVAPT